MNTATALLSTGVRLHYYEAGEGDDTIVLLHGWPQTGWQWRHVMPLLAEDGYRVIAPDLPEMLVTGRERQYLGHFVDRLGYRPEAVDLDFYVRAYGQPGALRAGFDLYRAFEQDARDLRKALADGGKLTVPALGLYGQVSRFADVTETRGREIADDVTTVQVPQTGHWLAEENPAAIARLSQDFARRPTH